MTKLAHDIIFLIFFIYFIGFSLFSILPKIIESKWLTYILIFSQMTAFEFSFLIDIKSSYAHKEHPYSIFIPFLHRFMQRYQPIILTRPCAKSLNHLVMVWLSKRNKINHNLAQSLTIKKYNHHFWHTKMDPVQWRCQKNQLEMQRHVKSQKYLYKSYSEWMAQCTFIRLDKSRNQ